MATWKRLANIHIAGAKCASDSCPGVPATWLMEAGGTGSYFCDACHDNITAKDLRPSETTATVVGLEFVDGEEDRKDGTYVTLRIDDPSIRWSAGRVAVRYIK